MNTAQIFLRIVLPFMCLISVLLTAFVIGLWARARYPLLGIERHVEIRPESKPGPQAAPERSVEPRPETVRAIGSAVLVGENPRNRLVLKGK